MAELPEEDIAAAEDSGSADHSHGGVAVDDGRLLEHLRSVHDLHAPGNLSGSTLRGLHDRLHDETDAVDDSSR